MRKILVQEKLPIYLILFFIPLEQLFNLIFNFDTSFKIYRVILIGYTILNLKVIVNQIIKSKLFYLGIIFVLGTMLAIIRLSLGFGSLDFMLNSFQHFILGMLLSGLLLRLNNFESIRTGLIFFFIGVCISALYGFVQYFSGGYFRLSGFSNNPNHLALSLNICSWIILSRNEGRLIPKFFLFSAFTFIIFFTGSRTGVLIQLINLLSIIYFYRGYLRRNALKSMIVLMVLFFLLLPKYFSSLNVFNRYEMENIQVASGRNDLAQSAFKLALETGFIGVGIGQYPYYHFDYLSKDAYVTVAENQLNTHNSFLDLLVNFGLISLILYLIFMKKIYNDLRKIKNNSLRSKAYVLALIILIYSFSQETFFLTYYWICVGFILTITKLKIRNYVTLF